MAIISLEKTIAIHDCHDMLRKLQWELKQIDCVGNSDLEGLAFTVQNAFISAWHLSEWVWRTMTEAQKDILRSDWKAPHMRDIGQFQVELRSRYRELAICRDITTASKHTEVTRNPEQGVSATTTIESLGGGYGASAYGAVPFAGYVTKCKIYVNDNGHRTEARWILENAYAFWRDFIFDRKIQYDAEVHNIDLTEK